MVEISVGSIILCLSVGSRNFVEDGAKMCHYFANGDGFLDRQNDLVHPGGNQ